jgi:hypothetical protein
MPVWNLRSLKKPLSPEPVTAGVTPPWLRHTGVRLEVMLVLFAAVGALTGVVEASGDAKAPHAGVRTSSGPGHSPRPWTRVGPYKGLFPRGAQTASRCLPDRTAPPIFPRAGKAVDR